MNTSLPMGPGESAEYDRFAEAETVSRALYTALCNTVPLQIERVMRGADIEPDFMGFANTYQALSRLIPLDWTVLDLGCAYAPQAYYFRHHARYIGVDVWPAHKRFHFSNTVHATQRIEHYACPAVADQPKVFCILNYVNCRAETAEKVRRLFRNLFVFYPEHHI